ncbi:hypothetical protein AB1L30_17930 [Bremerella sp. JC817]|uniref:hypothetical protein n=1 Tax=Bremerella sp. JC817 TaxID=3231756 RepID=UPI00345B3756
MAGEWMQMDLDLREKPEFRRIMLLTGEDRATVLDRLFSFWAWVERHTVDGYFPGLTVDALADMLGGTADFWASLADPYVDWLQITEDAIEVPRWEERFSQAAKARRKNAQTQAKKRRKTTVTKSSDASPQTPDLNQSSEKNNKNISGQSTREKQPKAKRSQPATPSQAPDPPACTDQVKAKVGKNAQGELFTEVELVKVLEVAEELFHQAGYVGGDGGIFYKAAGVLHTNPGKLTRHQLVDAARGCRGKGNAPGYFRQSIRNLCPDFDQLELGVWIEPRWPDRPPNQIPAHTRGALQLRGVPRSPTPGDPTEEARRQVLNQLEAVGA